MKKAVLFAPFWRQSNHIGNLRVDRFLRWLTADGFEVVMVRAGSQDAERQEPWGIEITVRDPLGLYHDENNGDTGGPPGRKPNRLRRAVAVWLFNPDPTIVWTRRAWQHATVLKHTADAHLIISSSPPESAHVGAMHLSKRRELAHIVDLRDGWLDEPLRALLRSSALRRAREGRLERKVLRKAAAILVTSDVWKKLLCERYPDLEPKVTVLTNGYPLSSSEAPPSPTGKPEDETLLIHGGKFIASRLTQSPEILLEPLAKGIEKQEGKGQILLLGALSDEELEIINRFVPRLEKHGWRVDCPGKIPREDLLAQLPRANGLLVLAATHAAVPGKFYEYVPTGRPMLVVTGKDSATWRLCEDVPQAFLIDTNSEADHGRVEDFLAACRNPQHIFSVPEQFSEKYLARLFQTVVRDSISLQ